MPDPVAPDPGSAPSGRPRRRRPAPASAPSVRLADVAARAGVSTATASRVLNGSTRVVDPALAERVLAAASELRYSVNFQAQATARGTSRSVVIVVGDIDDAYFSAIASGATAAADTRGLTVSLGVAGSDAGRMLPLLDAVRGQRPRALLVARSRDVDEDGDQAIAAAYDAIVTAGIRVAFLGTPRPGSPGVDVRHRAGAEALGRALAARGYREMAVLAGRRESVTAVERTIGFRAGAAQAVTDERVVHSAFSREGGVEAMHRLLDSGVRPDCVFAVTDVMAVGAMAALRERGIDPGADIAVAGFDDIPVARDMTPALSTVRLPLHDIGRRLLETALGEGDDLGDAIDGVVELRGTTPGRG